MYSVSRRLTKWKKDKEMKQKINELSILKNKEKKKKEELSCEISMSLKKSI